MTLLLIDGSSFIHRAFHALPALSRRDGTPTGAVAGFCSMMWGLLNYGAHKSLTVRPTHIGVVFDHPSRNFRHDLWPAYKANRSKRPDDLASQFGLVRQATAAFGLKIIEQRGFEADDLIATCATEARCDVTIMSADKDLMQLVGAGITMIDDMRGLVIDAAHVQGKFGVRPDQVADFLALVGDPGDNVPGVPAVGAQTAARLLNQFGDIDQMLRAWERIQPARIQHNIRTHADQLRLARQLVTLRCDVPLETTLDDLAWSGDLETGPIIDFCDTLELKTLRLKIERALTRAA